MKTKKLKAWLAAFFICTAAITGCQSTKPAETTAQITTTEAETIKETPAETDGKGNYPLTITDSSGMEVVLEEEPQKVVSGAPNMTEMVFALGQGDKLIGRTVYCDYPEEAAKVKTVGDLLNLDLEKIISIEPDVLLLTAHLSEEAESILKEAGIQIIVVNEENELEGVYSMIETVGRVLNAEKEASVAVEDMKNRIEQVAMSIAAEEVPSVYYVVGFGEYGDYTAGGDTFLHQMLTHAGGKNIAGDMSGWQFSLEKLVEADPEIIIIQNGMKESFVTDENYSNLSAVVNDRVYEIDNNLLERQGVRNAEGIEALAKIFHPGAFN